MLLTVLLELSEPLTARLPLLTVVVPAYVSVPESSSVPAPSLTVSPPPPLIAPESVKVLLAAGAKLVLLASVIGTLMALLPTSLTITPLVLLRVSVLAVSPLERLRV